MDEIKSLLNIIKTDIEYYKNKPHFIDIIEKLTKKKIIENLISDYESTLNKEKDYTYDINTLKNYIKKFEKKYINKIETSDGIVYEYENEYKFYPNKKSSHLESYFKDKFLQDSFDSIVIDNIKRPETFFSIDLKNDIKHSKTCFIIVLKKNI